MAKPSIRNILFRSEPSFSEENLSPKTVGSDWMGVRKADVVASVRTSELAEGLDES